MMLRSNRWSTYVLILTFAVIAGLADQALALRGRRRGYSNYNYTPTYTATNNNSTYAKRVAPKVDPESAKYRGLRVSYQYDPAMKEDEAFQDRLRVHLWIDDDQVLEHDGRIVAEVKLTDVSNYKAQHIRFVPLSIDAEVKEGARSAMLRIANRRGEQPVIEPSKVYRVFVNLHRAAEKQSEQTVIGRVPYPYYTATSGTTRLERARQMIVMRTFKEFYYRKNGWRTGERYSMDCYAYYMWATGFCTVGAQQGHTRLHQLFNAETPYNNGGHIAKLVSDSSIHGDYVRQPGHSFMLLAYDPHQKHVWTMEGNFNSTIEVVVRSLSSGWQVGHLRDRHIRPGLFERLKQRLRGRS